jgi:hypothetical protein
LVATTITSVVAPGILDGMSLNKLEHVT